MGEEGRLGCNQAFSLMTSRSFKLNKNRLFLSSFNSICFLANAAQELGACSAAKTTATIVVVAVNFLWLAFL